jgi:hypothetical protein
VATAAISSSESFQSKAVAAIGHAGTALCVVPFADAEEQQQMYVVNGVSSKDYDIRGVLVLPSSATPCYPIHLANTISE